MILQRWAKIWSWSWSCMFSAVPIIWITAFATLRTQSAGRRDRGICSIWWSSGGVGISVCLKAWRITDTQSARRNTVWWERFRFCISGCMSWCRLTLKSSACLPLFYRILLISSTFRSCFCSSRCTPVSAVCWPSSHSLPKSIPGTSGWPFSTLFARFSWAALN